MKLNNKNVFLTGANIKSSKSLDETRILDLYDHKQATIYYESGIEELDEYFKPNGYIKNGYVCTLVSYVDGINLFFFKFDRDDIKDLGVAQIERSKIVRFEEIPAINLPVVKKEDAKHAAKYVGKRAFGLVGSLAGLAADQFVSANLHSVNGVRYILLYLDSQNNEKSLVLYTSDEFKHDITLFLNTYYKRELPIEAQVKSKDNSSSCFVATACYRDIYSKEVIFFRKYRDEVLNNNFLGKLFIKSYYIISPMIYKYLFNRPQITKFIKFGLDKIYQYLK